MKFKHILITGGAGFVGSNLAIRLKRDCPDLSITSLDNLKRRGSELNVPRLKANDIDFVHGDIRNPEDLAELIGVDLIIEASAEPSVLAGLNGSPEYLLNTNLLGTINCLELARKNKAAFVFLSTSRIYPMAEINNLKFRETISRFELSDAQKVTGASNRGVAEDFPLGKVRSLYGATKLCSEYLLQEYINSYGIKGIINRCGVITGPWQMGKVDQGVIVLWLARHIWANKPLSYIGYGGSGKQVRDFMNVDDLYEALKIELSDIDKYSGEVFNLGGGVKNSLSLQEMTSLCEEITGNKIEITSVAEDRPNDLRFYITDTTKFEKKSGWKCQKDDKTTFKEIYDWIIENKSQLKNILN